MSDNVAPQSRCHLLGLPSEIRLLIYEELFPPRTINMIDKELELETAILATCRTIHGEAKPVLYEKTEFLITFHAGGRYIGPCDDIEDIAKRIWPLYNLAHKLSLAIVFGGGQRRRLRGLTSELTRLDEAPHLKQLHIKFENYGASLSIQSQLDLVVGVLGLVVLPAGVTVMLDSSMTTYDLQLSKWFESLDKLQWSVDVHHNIP